MNTETNSAATSYTGRIFAGAPGPYKLISMESTEDRALLNTMRQGEGLTYTTNLCGGSCDHCGTAIWNVFKFRAADGSTFKMGEECADQLMFPSDDDLSYETRAAHRAYVAKKNKFKRERKAALDAQKIEAGELWISENRAALSQLPHPKAWRAEKGETFADSLDWLMAHAGTSGKLKAIRDAHKALGYKAPRAKRS